MPMTDSVRAGSPTLGLLSRSAAVWFVVFENEQHGIALADRGARGGVLIDDDPVPIPQLASSVAAGVFTSREEDASILDLVLRRL